VVSLGVKIWAAVSGLALLLAAAGGGYYAYKTLDSRTETDIVISGKDEGRVVTRRSKVDLPGAGGEVVVKEEVSSGTEDLAISKEEAAKIEMPFAAEYFAQRLTDDEAIVSRQIYKGITEREETIYIKNDVVGSADICELIVMVVTGSPEIDYIDTNYSVQVDSDGYASAIFMNYTRSADDSEIRNMLTEQAIDRILAGMEPDWTDFRKYKYIHDALVNNCFYYESDGDCYTAYGCLVGGNAVCEGYSKALMLVCDRAGIPCLPVIGQGVNEDGSVQGHIWNKVMLDGEWYASDITWDDPVFESAENYLRYDYFSVTDEEMSRNHVQDENRFISEPVCIATKCDYYRYYGYFAETVDDADDAFSNAVRDAMANGEEYARIKCSDRECFDATLNWVFGDGTGNEELFDMIKQGVSDNPEFGYKTSGYSVINNAVTYNISIRLKK
jgi:hypothetical protein